MNRNARNDRPSQGISNNISSLRSFHNQWYKNLARKSWQGFRTCHETVTLLFHISFNNYHRKHLVTGKVKPHMYLIQDVHSKNKISSFKKNLVSNKIYNFIFWNENERKHDQPLFIYTLNFHNCIITLLTKYTNSIRNAILLWYWKFL